MVVLSDNTAEIGAGQVATFSPGRSASPNNGYAYSAYALCKEIDGKMVTGWRNYSKPRVLKEWADSPKGARRRREEASDRGWAEKEDIINTESVENSLKFFN